MKSREIIAGRTYQNLRGVHRRVDSIVDNPNNPTDLRSRVVAWTLTESKRHGQQTGTCPIYEFAWWAAAEVVIDMLPVIENPVEVSGTTPVGTPETPIDPADLDAVLQTKVGATDLVCAFTVVLTKETRFRDLEATLAAIGQIKGVATVAPVRADMQYFISRDQARREIMGQLREVLKG